MPLLSRAELWQKNGRIYEFTWKFALPQLSRGKTCPKIKLPCWCDFKIWSAPMITSWHFAKNSGSFDCAIWKFELLLLSQGKSVHENRAISIQSLKDSSFPHITSWTFRKNKVVLLRYFEILNCHYYHELKFSEQ